MKTLRLLIVAFLMTISLEGLRAQDMAPPDTTLTLESVTIRSTRISQFARGQAFQTLDSLTRRDNPAASLTELLQGFSTSYVRNYGQGTLATLSMRGTSANHAGLIWNGIRLSPPNIGYVDLSLIQGNFFQDIMMLYGGSSPMFGSGSIGGGVHLNNRPVFQPSASLDLGLSAGSFGTFAIEGAGTVSGNTLFSRTAFSLMNAQNNFSYENFFSEKEKLPHAAIFKAGIIQDIAIQLPDDQYIMATGWFQYAGREIPPTMTESVSEAQQLDRSWRTMLVWKDFNPRNTLEARLAYFNEFTRYSDPIPEIYSDIHSQSFITAFESTWELTDHAAVFAGTQYTYEYADLDFYSRPEYQQALAVYASFRYYFPKIRWQFSLNGRQEMLTGYSSPFLFSLGAEGKIWKVLSGRVSFSRNFRAPTLNERFWQPGGNPELEPEKSLNLEGGLFVDFQPGDDSYFFQVTAFNSKVSDWILWLPGSSYWSVENAQEVWSRGFEINGIQRFQVGEFTIHLAESYSFTRSTNEKKLFDLDASYQKQLIYTPVHRFLLKPGLEIRGYRLSLRGTYSGEIYTTKDNQHSLPGFFLLDAVIAKTLYISKKYPLTLQLNLNNMLDKEYQVVPYRPMPGFGVMGTVRAELDSSKFKGQSSKLKF
ncbi:MAG: TonB-dependent receptor [Bacteroidales bacterium]|nr:TonB-dependent receptor [Bacteroidales bacterium]